MSDKINILITLAKGYGLGDAVQMSAVLRHAMKYRTHWIADLQAEAGRYCIGRGIVNGECFEYGKNPNPDRVYDTEVLILLYDTFSNFHDRPNTRVSSCLHERFGLPWDAECGRYQIQVRPESASAAQALVCGWSQSGDWVKGKGYPSGGKRSNARCVAVHYEGDSSGPRKNLSHQQADEICAAVEAQGYQPVVLDWRHRSPLDYRRLRTPQEWGGDAEMVCAVISQCAAFVGIDSGPSKCASATETPALVVWTGHHPAPFHDPAPNTTHLVPREYHGLHPVCGDPGVIRWFEANHAVRQYDRDPVNEVKAWLQTVLK